LENEFEIYFQPQVRLSDKLVVAAEALLRWRHPERGILAPAATPKAIVDKASQEIAQVLAAADVKKRFEPQGVELVSSPPDKFDAVIKSDAERYGKLVKPAN